MTAFDDSRIAAASAGSHALAVGLPLSGSELRTSRAREYESLSIRHGCAP